MIVLTIALIIAGGVIVALAILAYRTIRENSRLEREKAYERDATDEARRKVEKLQAQKDMLFEENAELTDALDQGRQHYNRLQQENAALNARNTKLVEAMEAKPTQPAKRTVRKNVTQAHQQEEA